MGQQVDMSRRLHVAVVCSTFPKLSETFVLDHVTALLDRGHRVSIVASPPSSPEPVHRAVRDYGLTDHLVPRQRVPAARLPRTLGLLWRGATTRPGQLGSFLAAVRWGRRRGAPLKVVAELDALTRLQDVDVVHCHFGFVGATSAGAMLATGLTQPLVTTFHGSDIGRFERPRRHRRYADLFDRADALLTVSEAHRQRLVAFGASPSKTLVLRQGVDVSTLRYERRAARGGQLHVLSVGRLVEKKGFSTALLAVADLVARGVDVCYKIVGDGPERPRLRQLIAEHGLAGRVEMCGPRSRVEVRRLLYAADVLLVPSQTASDGDREGIPVVLMEAMATGLPVVATAHSGIPELVKHGTSGVLTPEADPAALADALQGLWVNPGEAQRMAAAARSHVEAEHDARKQVDRLESLYYTLTESRTGVPAGA